MNQRVQLEDVCQGREIDRLGLAGLTLDHGSGLLLGGIGIVVGEDLERFAMLCHQASSEPPDWGELMIHLAVTAKNADSRRYRVRLAFDGAWQPDVWEHLKVLEVTPLDEPRWWARRLHGWFAEGLRWRAGSTEGTAGSRVGCSKRHVAEILRGLLGARWSALRLVLSGLRFGRFSGRIEV